ncbi:hypothetical protein [Halobiforma nitratireducens]|uniref:DUF7998 domain-containing protein n=1 Tax=Halobiforma nitratireducens JCM 10879 TaxID=1227454 RepID=M0M4F8_9EURY|nr:hypothetical protein [Halobiforma nitratireducens]EMA39489.1 hypothetical protein C446_08571 [Halobiforma nitratireducens JCM 10879]
MFGASFWAVDPLRSTEMNPFSRGATADGDGFDEIAEFVPENVPDPGSFLEGHDLLVDEEHVAFHELTEELFEERGVYDATFGYNLARLNLDHRHPEAGYRYAVEADDPTVLRAEFTPTTEFCPQADALTKGSFRAWNGLSDRHQYELVRVRVRRSHHQAAGLNDTLERLEKQFLETGRVPGAEASEERADDDEAGEQTRSPF